MKQELLDTCKEEPEVYLHLNLQNQIQREHSLEKEKGKKEEQIKREEKKEVIKKYENVE